LSSPITIAIPHVDWRDGRPRFNPSPALRKLGYQRENLTGDAGQWMTLAEVETWITARLDEVAERRARKDAGKRLAPLQTRSDLYTVERMFDDLWRSPRFLRPKPLDTAPVAGLRLVAKPALTPREAKRARRREHARLGAKTIQDYKIKAGALAKFDPELWGSPIAAISRPVAKGLHERLWAEKGLPMANGVIAVFRLAMSHAYDHGRFTQPNPLLKLRLPAVEPRIRVGTAPEIDALMAAADSADPDIADPELGDAIMLALYTGQRQGDVLQLSERNEENGKIRFIQNKTGARVRVRALPPLVDRLAAARQRKLVNGHQNAPTIVVSRHTGQPIAGMQCTKRFAKLRAAAAKTCPSVADFWFMDLRDTAVTRLALATCTMPEIASITGHSIETINTVVKHYLELREEHADAAITKLAAWLEAEGIAA
jgi:integrase